MGIISQYIYKLKITQKMIIQDERKLKMWISHVVEDISDAEPDALAKYVIALVKKPHSDADLEKLCTEKLSVFLQTHTNDFVTRLFATLKSGDYLTHKLIIEQNERKQYEAEVDKNSDNVVAKETDELLLTDPEPESEHEMEPSPTEKVNSKKITTQSKSNEPVQHSKIKLSTKTELSSSSKEDSQKLAPELPRKAVPLSPTPAAKPSRKRISPPIYTSAERRAERRSSPIRRRIIIGTVGGENSGVGLRVQNRYRDVRRAVPSKSRSRSPHIRKGKRPEIRRRCRDFHDKGFCMRGDICPHDHGPAPVVVEDSALEKMVRNGTVFDPTSAYDVNPPPPGMESASSSTGNIKPQKTLLEETPSLATQSVTTRIDFSLPPPPIPQIVQRSQLIYPPGTAPPTSILQPYSSGIFHIRPENAMTFPIQTTTIYGKNPSVQFGTFGGGTGNGTMMRGSRFKPYSIANRNPESRSLLVKKVPAELNTISQLDQHFSKFGQVTNIQVQYEGRLDTALVSFKTRRDAMMAYKSTEPIFNNRFIKVFWQNDVQAQTFDINGVVAESGTAVGAISKTFAKPIASISAIQKRQESESNAGESAMKTEEMATTTIDEIESNSATFTTPPIQNPIQGRTYGGAKVATMKQKADKEKIRKLMEVHKMKTDLYAEMVNQQKTLLKKLKNTEEKEQKKKLMEILKKTEGQAEKVKIELEELGAKIRDVQQKRLLLPVTV